MAPWAVVWPEFIKFLGKYREKPSFSSTHASFSHRDLSDIREQAGVACSVDKDPWTFGMGTPSPGGSSSSPCTYVMVHAMNSAGPAPGMPMRPKVYLPG